MAGTAGSSTRPGGHLAPWARPYIPGVAAFVVLFFWTNRRGGIASNVLEGLYQNLGTTALREEMVSSLRVNHIQPPGLNLFFAVAARTTRPMLFISVFYFIASIGTVILIVRTLLDLGLGGRLAGGSGLLYGLLPSTVLSALYPYNTTFICFFVALLLWAMVSLRSRPLRSGVCWIVGALGIFMVRASFVWLFVILWILVPLFLLRGATPRLLRWCSGIGVLAVLLVQAHYTFTFGIATTSSWSGQNYVRAVVASGAISPEDLIEAAGNDLCLASIAKRPNFFGQVSSLPLSCFRGHDDLDGSLLALQDVKEAGFIQQNSLARLQLSDRWDDLAGRVFRRHPMATLKLMLGRGQAPSSLELLARPAFSTEPYRDNLRIGTPFLSLTRPLEAVFPSASLVAVLWGATRIAKRPRRANDIAVPLPERDVYRVGLCLLAYAIVVGSALEYGENMRFLQEIYPMLVVLGAVSVWRLTRRREAGEAETAARPIP